MLLFNQGGDILVTIDTKAYILRMLTNILSLYLLIFILNRDTVAYKKYNLFILFILTFLADIFIHFSDAIPIFGGYFLLKLNSKKDIVLLSKIIICVLVNYCISMISSTTMLVFFSDNGIKSYPYVCTQIILEIILLILFLLIYKKYHLDNLIKNNSSKLTIICLFYLVAITIFVSYITHYYQIFDLFILGILIFLIIQTIFVFLLFIRINIKQKKKYEEKLKNQELMHLKKYTDQLEKKQEELIKFRHDYKNLLLSFKEAAVENNNNELLNQLEQLEDYSNCYLSNEDFDYRHFHLIKNNYLKSLLISKFYKANKYQINCHFECLEIIDKVPIPIFDCIRVLGIVLDNATEASKQSENKIINFMVYKDNNQIEFLIENSCLETSLSINHMLQSGFSTKKNHEGVGLSTVQDINKNNSNMFVQYQKKQNLFITQITLIW